ncbi:MAG TPA: hypothetical protein DCX17_01380, partial [Firmicutes bacterium]|nr:hypothetical protein [Bacillota bacterium]
HVHDLVDFVSMEGKMAGKNATKYVFEQDTSSGSFIKVVPQTGISYAVPQRIDVQHILEPIEFKFRVSKPKRDIFISISQGERLLKRAFHPVAIPSEMINMTLPATSQINDDEPIFISIKERA